MRKQPKFESAGEAPVYVDRANIPREIPNYMIPTPPEFFREMPDDERDQIVWQHLAGMRDSVPCRKKSAGP